VPFRVQDLGVTPEFNVTIAAGVRFEMSGSIDAFNANFNIEGTEAEPVVFTSARRIPSRATGAAFLYSYTTAPRASIMPSSSTRAAGAAAWATASRPR
jgi:hypothetical protein